jgi:hypothetical protein
VSDLSRATEEAREICFKTYQMSEAEKFSLGENSDRNNLEDDTSRLADVQFVQCSRPCIRGRGVTSELGIALHNIVG